MHTDRILTLCLVAVLMAGSDLFAAEPASKATP